MNKLMATVLFGFALLQGCASVDVMQMGILYEQKDLPCEIDITSTPPSDKKYTDVCLITARGGLFSKNVEDLFPGIIDEACDCGADAVLIKSTRQGGWSFDLAANRAEASALAIRYHK